MFYWSIRTVELRTLPSSPAPPVLKQKLAADAELQPSSLLEADDHPDTIKK